MFSAGAVVLASAVYVGGVYFTGVKINEYLNGIENNETITHKDKSEAEKTLIAITGRSGIINDIKVDRNYYEEICYNALSSAIQIFNRGKLKDELKVDLINQVIGTVLNIGILYKV